MNRVMGILLLLSACIYHSGGGVDGLGIIPPDATPAQVGNEIIAAMCFFGSVGIFILQSGDSQTGAEEEVDEDEDNIEDEDTDEVGL